GWLALGPPGGPSKPPTLPNAAFLAPPQKFHHFRELDVLSAQLFHERIYSVSPHLLFQVLDLGSAFAVPLGHLTERFLQLFLEHRHTRLDALLLFRGDALEGVGVHRLTAASRREGNAPWRAHQ